MTNVEHPEVEAPEPASMRVPLADFIVEHNFEAERRQGFRWVLTYRGTVRKFGEEVVVEMPEGVHGDLHWIIELNGPENVRLGLPIGETADWDNQVYQRIQHGRRGFSVHIRSDVTPLQLSL